jgi:peptidoglycan/xylan/chitin deacetylase (PgdA/CDA1 family)
MEVVLKRTKQANRIIGIALACILILTMTFGGFPRTIPCDATEAEDYVANGSRSIGGFARAHFDASERAAAAGLTAVTADVRSEPVRLHINWMFSVYREPDFRAERVTGFNPQYVSVLSETDDGWAMISTYLGELWTNLNENRRFIDRDMALYKNPGDSRPTAFISPQVVNVLAEDGYWLQVETWLGPMWLRMPAIPPPDARLVALTFDDGPSEHTPRLLDALGARSVSATFFVTGNNVNANSEIAARITSERHEIACHTYSHPYLASLSADRIRTELSKSRDAIFQATGREPSLFRPTYGVHNSTVRDVVEEFNMPLILWSIDTRDWEHRNLNAIMSHIVNGSGIVRVSDGDIILMHDTFSTTVDAAVQIVDLLLSEGFYFVTVSQLLSIRHGGVEPGRVYNSGRQQNIEQSEAPTETLVEDGLDRSETTQSHVMHFPL